MAVQIHPCRMCPLREGCGQREVFRERAKGSEAISIRFRCWFLDAHLIPGRRIVISTPVNDTGPRDPEFSPMLRKAVRATITASHDARFACTIDRGEIADEEIADSVRDASLIRFRRMQPHHRIVRFLLDEPVRDICRSGYVVDDNGCDTPAGDCPCDRAAGIG